MVQQDSQSGSQRRLMPPPKLPSVERTAAAFGSKAKIKNADPYVLGKTICVPIRSVQMTNWRVPSQPVSMATLLQVSSVLGCTSLYQFFCFLLSSRKYSTNSFTVSAGEGGSKMCS